MVIGFWRSKCETFSTDSGSVLHSLNCILGVPPISHGFQGICVHRLLEVHCFYLFLSKELFCTWVTKWMTQVNNKMANERQYFGLVRRRLVNVPLDFSLTRLVDISRRSVRNLRPVQIWRCYPRVQTKHRKETLEDDFRHFDWVQMSYCFSISNKENALILILTHQNFNCNLTLEWNLVERYYVLTYLPYLMFV